MQGVFYRKFAQEAAIGQNITGFVRNTRDGDVAGEAQGTPKALEKFEKELKKGSRHSLVHKVKTEEREVKEGEEKFEVVH